MKRVVITPTTTAVGANRGIEFDLKDVLRALGERAVESRWSCLNVRCVTRDDRDIDVLARAGEDLLLMLDGELVATDANGCRWAVIWVEKARNWEVWTDDESVLQAVASRLALRVALDGLGPRLFGFPVRTYISQHLMRWEY